MTVRALVLVLLGIVFMSSVGCDVGDGPEPEGGSSTAPAVLGDGEWELRVDRFLYDQPRDVRFPPDNLTEADFRPVSGGPTYRVVVSEQGSRVSIGVASFEDSPLEGRRTAVTGGRHEYDLSESTFAGGRFVVWPAKGGLQGVNLEQVLPKRAKASDWGAAFSADERKEYLHRLGNLALLQKGPNGRIGNKPFSDKKTALSGSGFKLTKEIGGEVDWTKQMIIARQERLAALAVKVWAR